MAVFGDGDGAAALGPQGPATLSSLGEPELAVASNPGGRLGDWSLSPTQPITPRAEQDSQSGSQMASELGQLVSPPSILSASSTSTQLVHAGLTPQGYFYCVKCRINKPLAELQMRSGKAICCKDVNSYAALANRWKSNRTLRTWFNALSEQQKTEWYRKHQECSRGVKRDFDSLNFEQFSRQEAVSSDTMLDDWIPLTIYIRRKYCEGVVRTQAIAEFRALVLAGSGPIRQRS